MINFFKNNLSSTFIICFFDLGYGVVFGEDESYGKLEIVLWVVFQNYLTWEKYAEK